MSVTQSATFEGSSGSSGAAAAEAIGGVAAIVLTILGLAHVAPVFLVAIATIAIGVALLAQGSTIAMEYARLITGRGETIISLGGGSTWSMDLLAGAAGIVLGILALLNVTPVVLVAIAAIAFGGGLVLSTGAAAQVLILKATAPSTDEHIRRLAAETASTSAVAQGMTGLSAVVLGILALAGFSSITLVLIALLASGVLLVMNGSTVSGLMLSVFRH